MSPLHNEAELNSFFQTLATTILESHPKKDFRLVGILSAGYPIAQRLNTLLELSHPVGQLDVGLYRDDLGPKGDFVTIRESNIPFSIDDQTIILVDDVIHHGRTAAAALQAISDFGRAKTIELATLIDRGERQLPIQPNYTGHHITSLSPDQKLTVSLYEINGEDCITTIPS